MTSRVKDQEDLFFCTPVHPQLFLLPRRLRAAVGWPDSSTWIGLQSQWVALFKAQHAWVWLPVEILSSPQGSSESSPLPTARHAFQQKFREDGLGKCHPDSGSSVPCSPLFFSSGSPLYEQTLAFPPAGSCSLRCGWALRASLKLALLLQHSLVAIRESPEGI